MKRSVTVHIAAAILMLGITGSLGCSSSAKAPPRTHDDSSSEESSSKSTASEGTEDKWEVQEEGERSGSIRASDEARQTLGVERWRTTTSDDKTTIITEGLDAKDKVLGKLEVRQTVADGNTTLAVAFTDSDGTVTSATTVLDANGNIVGKPVSDLSPTAMQWMQILQKDVNAFKSQGEVPYSPAGCVAASLFAVGGAIGVIGTCVTPVVVAVLPCAGAITIFAGCGAGVAAGCFGL